MNVNFNGYGENVLTFIADSGLTETGVPVKISDDGTVAKCDGNDNFCGICVGLRDGYAAVQLAGYVRVAAAGGKNRARLQKACRGKHRQRRGQHLGQRAACCRFYRNRSGNHSLISGGK